MLSQFICKEWYDHAFWIKPLSLVKKNLKVVIVLAKWLNLRVAETDNCQLLYNQSATQIVT